jgi:hypothetical protein
VPREIIYVMPQRYLRELRIAGRHKSTNICIEMNVDIRAPSVQISRKHCYLNRRNVEMELHNGEIVGVPCSIRTGHFPHERLIAVDADSGPLVGFADPKNLQTIDGERGLIRGVVVDTSKDPVVVRLFGEFFRTAMGLTHVQRELLTRLEA